MSTTLTSVLCSNVTARLERGNIVAPPIEVFSDPQDRVKASRRKRCSFGATPDRTRRCVANPDSETETVNLRDARPEIADIVMVFCVVRGDRIQ
jgi:hypothetical protein